MGIMALRQPVQDNNPFIASAFRCIKVKNVSVYVCNQLLYQGICVFGPFLLFHCWQWGWGLRGSWSECGLPESVSMYMCIILCMYEWMCKYVLLFCTYDFFHYFYFSFSILFALHTWRVHWAYPGAKKPSDTKKAFRCQCCLSHCWTGQGGKKEVSDYTIAPSERVTGQFTHSSIASWPTSLHSRQAV